MGQIKNMLENGGYIIDVNSSTKTIDMNVVGVFTPKQAEEFHKDYQASVTSVNANDFILKVDCTDMKVINQEMVPSLQHSFELYKSTGFSKIEFLITNSSIIKMQLKRIANSAGLPNYEILEK